MRQPAGTTASKLQYWANRVRIFLGIAPFLVVCAFSAHATFSSDSPGSNIFFKRPSTSIRVDSVCAERVGHTLSRKPDCPVVSGSPGRHAAARSRVNRSPCLVLNGRALRLIPARVAVSFEQVTTILPRSPQNDGSGIASAIDSWYNPIWFSRPDARKATLVGLPMNTTPETEINGTTFVVGLLATRRLAGNL